MRRMLTIVGLLSAMLPAFVLGPASASAGTTATNGTLVAGIPVTGTCENKVTGETGTFTGVLKPVEFVIQDGALFLQGTLSGTCSVGGSITDVPVLVPITDIPVATCEILVLQTGPIHLDLLGLVIDVSAITILITAEPGPGNLLGNLLCAIAGLLDRGGPLGLLDDLLNAVLDELKGLLR